MVVLDGQVLTMDEANPSAQAFAVQGGKFSAVGNQEDITAWVGPNTRVVDAKGLTIFPLSTTNSRLKRMALASP